MIRKVWWKTLLVFVIIISSQNHFTQNSYAKKPDFFFDLFFEISYLENAEKTASYVIDDLKNIGINASFGSFDYLFFCGPPKIPTGNLNCLYDISIGNIFRTPYYYFDDDGYWSQYGCYKNDFPYNVSYMNESMEMIEEFQTITNINTQISKYKEWQDFTQDKILLVLPLFDLHRYAFAWNNLKGFDYNWGISDSLPYMFFEGLHENQNSVEELNLYKEISHSGIVNPITEYFFEDKINTFFMEPLLKLTPDMIPTKRGLIKDWEFVDENHIKFYMRDGIFWSPSYNITNYDGKSGSPTLMAGLKNNETSIGSNQKITAYDAVFTLLKHSNTKVEGYNKFLPYVRELYVDPEDNLTFHMKTDFNNIPVENKPYNLLWEDLQVFCLPEFFLNSTNTTITHSSGGIRTWGLYDGIWSTPQWDSYRISPFGCGKYNINHSIPYERIVLEKNPSWHGIGAIDGNTREIIINKVRFLYKPEMEAFENGKIDIITAFSYDYTKSKLKNYCSDSDFHCYTKTSGYQQVIVFNLYNEYIGGDKNFEFLVAVGKEDYTKGLAVRKAIAYAINRERINEEIFNSTYSISQSLISQKYSSWRSKNMVYNYNLTAAWEWMEAAGYHKDSLRASMYRTIFSPIIILIFVITLKSVKKNKRRREIHV